MDLALKTVWMLIVAALLMAASAGAATACKPKVVDEGLTKWSGQFQVMLLRRKGFKCVDTGQRRTFTVPQRVRARNCPINRVVEQRRPDNCTAGVRSDKIRFRAACFEHDVCYSTRGATRQECDRLFKTNLLYICDKIENRGACRLSANSFFAAVTVAGARRYRQFQDSAPRDPNGAVCQR